MTAYCCVLEGRFSAGALLWRAVRPTRFLAPRAVTHHCAAARPLFLCWLFGALCARPVPSACPPPPFLSRSVCSRTAVLHVPDLRVGHSSAALVSSSGEEFVLFVGTERSSPRGAVRIPDVFQPRAPMGRVGRATPSGLDVWSVSIRFGGYASGSRPRNLCLPESQRCSLLFSSRSSVVSAFVLGLRSAVGRCSRVSAGVYICGVEIN